MGIHQAFLGSGGGRVVSPLTDRNVVASSISAEPTVTVKTDGTLYRTGISSATDQWFEPTTAGIGSSYWVRFTVTAGDALSYTPGSGWLQISEDRLIGNVREGKPTSVVLIEIASDSGGSNVVTSGTFTIYTI